MKASDIPTKFSTPFATNAGPSFVRDVPVTTADPVAASDDQGFPPDTFTPVGAGGTPPDGRDVNGILRQSTRWNRWQSAGGPVKFDAVFSAAIGGYPSGAIVASATTGNVYWLSTVDDNVTDPDAGGAGWTSFLALGGIATGGKLIFSSTTQITLAPYDGGYLWINGVNQPIPAALNLSNAGIGASTSNFIYAFMSGATMTLEASATGYAKNTLGIPQKIGDRTRTLVGAIVTDAGGLFQSGATSIGVVSWFNRTLLNAETSLATVVFSSGTYQKLSAALDIPVFVWADSAALTLTDGTMQCDLAGSLIGVQQGIDGAASGSQSQASTPGNNYQMVFSSSFNGPLAEGAHVVSPFVKVVGGTGIANQIYNRVQVMG